MIRELVNKSPKVGKFELKSDIITMVIKLLLLYIRNVKKNCDVDNTCHS